MTQNEKVLTDALVRLRNIVDTAQGLYVADVARNALDALLVEHRAEVEALKADNAALLRLLRDATDCMEDASLVGRADDLRDVFEASHPGAALLERLRAQEAECAATRDAALEEAAGVTDSVAVNCGDKVLALNIGKHIRALKSQPAERYIRESEVVPVLAWAADLLKRQGYGFGIIRDIAKRLGVDFDGDGVARQRCSMCAHAMAEHDAVDGCTVVTNDPEQSDACPCAARVTNADKTNAPHDALVATDGTTAMVLDVAPGFRVDTRQTCVCGHSRSEHDVAGRIQVGEVDTVCAGFRAFKDTRQTCTCTGTCRGPDGLGAGWKCALGKDTHTEHCCQRHGCKYGDALCTVTSGERMQSFPCAECEVLP